MKIKKIKINILLIRIKNGCRSRISRERTLGMGKHTIADKRTNKKGNRERPDDFRRRVRVLRTATTAGDTTTASARTARAARTFTDGVGRAARPFCLDRGLSLGGGQGRRLGRRLAIEATTLAPNLQLGHP